MKKHVSRFLALTLVLSLLISSAGLNWTMAAAEGTEAPKGFKIGFAYLPESDSLSKTYRNSLRYLAEAFGCEMLFADMLDASTEAVMGYYESLIQQGAQALIMLGAPSVAFLTELEEKGIYFTCYSSPDEDVNNFLMNSKYFCGKLVSLDVTKENYDPEKGVDYQVTMRLLDSLYAQGRRKMVYVGYPAGYAGHDNRYRAWTDFMAAHPDVTPVSEYRGVDAASGVSDILASYGAEIDSICVANPAFSSAAAAVIQAGYQGQIMLSSFDMQDTIPELMKAGMVAGVGGGNTSFFELCFTMLYNSLSGADDVLSVSAERYIPIPDIFVIANQEEYGEYEKYFLGDVPAFSADEMKQLCSWYTPDTTIEEKNAYLWWLAQPENYNLQAVAERHAELVK